VVRSVGPQPVGAPAATAGADLREVLRARPFRRLWLVLGLSSLGDWMGLLASAAFASARVSGATAQGVAFGSVIAVQLLPALLLGPVAGVVADRFDRRRIMVAADLARAALFCSIPAISLLSDRPVLVVAWAGAAMFAVQVAGLVWTPAKEAAVPNLVPPGRLETANQLTLFTTYGFTPVLAALSLAALTRLPAAGGLDATGIALFFDGATFLACALVVFFGVPEISGRVQVPAGGRRWAHLLADLAEGGRYVFGEPLIRGLLLGILGAFSGAGVVIGTARFYAGSLGGGDATFALLFAALFTGFGLGVAGGPVLVGRLSRRRWFGCSIGLAGAAVAGLALAPRLGVAAVGAALVGVGAGMAFLSGITLLGAEVPDDRRGRVFAFVQTAVRVILLASVSAASVGVGLGSGRLPTVLGLPLSASRLLLCAAGCCGVLVGGLALRQMDDRAGVLLRVDVWRAVRRRPLGAPPGLHVVLTGPDRIVAEQTVRLAAALRRQGREVTAADGYGDAESVREAVAHGVIVLGHATADTRPDLLVDLGDRAGGRRPDRVAPRLIARRLRRRAHPFPPSQDALVRGDQC